MLRARLPPQDGGEIVAVDAVVIPHGTDAPDAPAHAVRRISGYQPLDEVANVGGREGLSEKFEAHDERVGAMWTALETFRAAAVTA